jgi:hypothetical protein
MTSIAKHVTRLAGFAGVAFAVSGCGYALAGRGNALPATIKVIGVPMLVNQSTTPDLDRILTEAIRQELLAKGRYTVVPRTTGVDAVLTGVIMPVRMTPMGLTQANQASRYLVTVIASVEFREQPADTVFWANPSFRLSEEYPVPSGSGGVDQTALFQADTQALERLARNFARSLVMSILESM